MSTYKTQTVLFLSAIFSCLYFSSCTTILLKAMGVKKARPVTNEQVSAFVKDKQLDYDYLIRPNNDSDLTAITHFMNIGFNSIVLYDNSGNEIGNTNDSSCHMNLRSQITALLRMDKYEAPTITLYKQKNARQIIDAQTSCLNCSDGRALFDHELKHYVLFFSFATYIPIKKKLSDLDYVQELKSQNLRNKVTIVLINADLH